MTGSEVVQLYITLPTTTDGLTHPDLQLKAFVKVYDLWPGQSKQVQMTLDKYAVSYWEERSDVWTVDKGTYTIHVGMSSASLDLRAKFRLARGFEWTGL